MTEKNYSSSPKANTEDYFDGLLYKYTNFAKGWQCRYFLLASNKGILQYYMPEEKKSLRPRGFIRLSGSTISPSEEDSQTFTVSSESGETYKLKATNANERQIWVNKLRQVALDHQNSTDLIKSKHKDETKASLDAVRNNLMQTQMLQRLFMSQIESYTSTDEDLLTLKALSNSTVIVLEQCYVMLLQSSKRNI